MSTPLFGAIERAEARKSEARKRLNYYRLMNGELIPLLICTATSTVADNGPAHRNQRNILTAENASRMVRIRISLERYRKTVESMPL